MNTSASVSIERRDSAVHVGGALTLATARSALEAASDSFRDAKGERLVFDLSGVEESDSAAVAVLLEWMRQARRKELALVYRNVPERLRQLAQISDLETVLGIDSAG